jgi:2-polyprenyl-6-methoxyphenol hydroxylase-like FAD-dependent oxidoreductase
VGADLEGNVVIVGGGIGGLAAAAFLQRAGIEAHVFEQASELTEIGAGLVLAPNAVRLLRRLGLHERLARVAVRLQTGWQFRRWEDGRVLFSQQMGDRCEALYGEAAWTIHRADLVALLAEAVDPSTVHLGARFAGLDVAPDRVTARFDGHPAVTGRLLVGADGIRSAVRPWVSGADRPRNAGVSAWRVLVPAEQAPPATSEPVQTLWIGPGRHLVHYPISAGRLINVVAFSPERPDTVESWLAQGARSDFAAEFAGWDDRVLNLIRAGGEPGLWAVYDRPPVDRFVRGRVVLLGDAAHPMLPFFAQGAGQAIEDAAALAVALGSHPWREALRRYEAVRVPRAHQVQTASHGRLHVNHLPDGPEQEARDAGFGAQDPLESSRWLYAYDAERAMGEAEPSAS